MNKITLLKLILKNFKGIKELSIDFSKVTNISGENATGKTTVFDAFTYLMFDKDSQDRSKFEAHPLDANNKVIHMLDTEVEGTLDVNGKIITLKKVLKEKWTRKKGEEQAELKGTETSYYIDEVPVKMLEYKAEINGLIDENLFKLLSNPIYFSTNMKWQDRRTVLLDIIGDVSPEEVINYKGDLKALETLLKDKDIDTLKKQIQARKKILNEDKKSIPSRVDENTKSIKEIDFEALEFRKRGIVGGIKSLEEQLLDSSKGNDEVLKEKDKLYTMKTKLRDMEYQASLYADKTFKELKKQLQDAKDTLGTEKSRLAVNKRKVETLLNDIKSNELTQNTLRAKWSAENEKNFELPSDAKCCPTCRREYESDDIEAERENLEGNFNENKAKNLSYIRTQGITFADEIKEFKMKIKNIDIEKLEMFVIEKDKCVKESEFKVSNYETKDPLLADNGYQALKIEMLELEKKLQHPITVNNQAKDLRERKSNLEVELEKVNEELSHKKSNEGLRKRINKLMEEEKRLSQQIAELEGQEFLCEEFIKTKVELLESGINSKFKYVTFKLFDAQKNGGINECCEALVQGVPFNGANTASQINAGLDIINTLSSHYAVVVPLFIDNRESINQLIETDNQVINLIVSSDKKLKIESEEI